ncbi:hypothetical protein MBLNU457_7031t1 [Dothideomycetes sp. NU457]
MRSTIISLVFAAFASICLGAIASPQLPIPLNGLESLQQPTISKSHYSNDLIGLHKNLTTIESISLNELKVGQWLKSFLEEQGYSTEAQEVEKERYNILAWPGKKRNAKTLVTSHVDTVPPFYDYQVRKDGKKTMISGRGSVDAKASVAAQIIATNQLLSSGKIHADDVVLLYVVGEEIHGDGMRAANSLGLTPDTVIFGEPTEGKLASGHKGMLGFKIRALGKAAHSGYPWLGRSANEVLVKALAALMELGQNLPRSDKYGVTTINIGKMMGGVAANVVAETAEAQIAVRIAEGTPAEIKKACLDAVNAAVSEYTDGGEEVIEIEFTSAGYGPVSIDHDIPGFDTMVVNYGTDIPNFDFTDKSQKRYLYGPGSILVAHSDHEIISLDDLERAVEDYKTLILHSLKK